MRFVGVTNRNAAGNTAAGNVGVGKPRDTRGVEDRGIRHDGREDVIDAMAETVAITNARGIALATRMAQAHIVAEFVRHRQGTALRTGDVPGPVSVDGDVAYTAGAGLM